MKAKRIRGRGGLLKGITVLEALVPLSLSLALSHSLEHRFLADVDINRPMGAEK